MAFVVWIREGLEAIGFGFPPGQNSQSPPGTSGLDVIVPKCVKIVRQFF